MKKSEDRIKLIPLVFALGFIPMIVRLHVYDSGFEGFDWFPVNEDGIMYDFFLYFKAAAVIITAAVMLFFIIHDCIKGKKSIKTVLMKKPVRCLMAYLALVLISGIFSKYKRAVFFGSAEVFESLFVIAGYVVFMIYAMLYADTGERKKTVLKYSLIGFALISLTAFLQLVKTDPLKTDFVKSLMIPGKYAGLRDGLEFTFDLGVVYATLYNSNYVVQYFGFTLFISVSLLFCKSIKPAWKICCALTALLSLCAVAGSDSRTGLISVAFCLVIFALFMLCDLLKKKGIKRPYPIVFCSALLLFAVLLFVLYARRGSLGSFLKMSAEEGSHIISDVRTEKDYVELTINDNRLRISGHAENDGYYPEIIDEEGNEPEFDISRDQGTYTLSDEKYAGLTLNAAYYDDRLCFEIGVDGLELVFSDFGGEDGYMYLNDAGKFVKFKKYERSGLFPDSLFNDRGYIWNCCINLIPRYILRGSGTNAFVYAFPNDDDFIRLYTDNSNGIEFYDVKAHSLYFQQAVENGLLSLVFFVIFYIFTVAALFKDASKERENEPFSYYLKTGIFFGSLCYMIAGLTVDSNVNTAPVFWILLGLASDIDKTRCFSHN